MLRRTSAEGLFGVEVLTTDKFAIFFSLLNTYSQQFCVWQKFICVVIILKNCKIEKLRNKAIKNQNFENEMKTF